MRVPKRFLGRFICAAATLSLTISSAAQAQTVTAIVPSPPPANPPTIEPLAESAAEKNIIAMGTCEAGLVVKLFSNNLFSGSTVCKTTAAYELSFDLQEGANELIARQYDALNQPSPDSDLHTVYYLSPSAQPNLPGEAQSPESSKSTESTKTAKFALRIAYEYTLQSLSIGQAFRLPIKFTGGSPPYAINVDWGDGQSSLVSRPDSSPMVSEHTFSQPGPHVVKVHVSDKDEESAYLQFVLTVHGAPNAAALKLPFVDLPSATTAATFFSGAVVVTGVALPSALGGLLLGRYIWKVRVIKNLLKK